MPQIFDLWQDPQKRYDIFMTNFKESTWIAPVMVEEVKKLMKTYVDYPPRKLQSLGYTGPITISNYQKFEWVREQLKKDGISLPMPSGNQSTGQCRKTAARRSFFSSPQMSAFGPKRDYIGESIISAESAYCP